MIWELAFSLGKVKAVFIGWVFDEAVIVVWKEDESAMIMDKVINNNKDQSKVSLAINATGWCRKKLWVAKNRNLRMMLGN